MRSRKGATPLGRLWRPPCCIVRNRRRDNVELPPKCATTPSARRSKPRSRPACAASTTRASPIRCSGRFSARSRDLDGHLAIIANFWSKSLLRTERYEGHPFAVHINLPVEPRAFRPLAGAVHANGARKPSRRLRPSRPSPRRHICRNVFKAGCFPSPARTASRRGCRSADATTARLAFRPKWSRFGDENAAAGATDRRSCRGAFSDTYADRRTSL